MRYFVTSKLQKVTKSYKKLQKLQRSYKKGHTYLLEI